ncbi:MAG: hypothetical protein JXB19_06120 [Bacteroidales bacterium]|nr:hypothetical protein [Bacteroidales bacterium]
MKDNEIHKLRNRRQYLIVPEEIDCPFHHEKIIIGQDYLLYAHPDIIITEISLMQRRLILLGDIFDFRQPEINNHDILKDLVCFNFQMLLEKISEYTGRYVLIYIEKDVIRLIHDATATRKIYYCQYNNKLWFASRPNLLGKLLNLKKTSDLSKIDFYHSDAFKRLNNSNVGNTTIYDEVFQLIPNHYYDLNKFQSVRYWPNKKIEYLTVSTVAEKCATIIKGYIKSISNRYPVMLPVTAGKDSRLLLAATKDISDQVYYYINKMAGMTEKCNDIRIPKKLMSKLGLAFHIEEPIDTIDNNFKNIYFENNELASDRYLSVIYNYFVNHQDRVNLPGNIATEGFGLLYYPGFTSKGESIAKVFKLHKYKFAAAYYSDWLSGCKDICKKNNVNIANLFYWEERLANFGTQIQLEKDIAQEDFNPFNSRFLITLFLSLRPGLIKPPRYFLHKKITRLLWPEVLCIPTNPGIKKSIKIILTYIGLLGILKRFQKRIF